MMRISTLALLTLLSLPGIAAATANDFAPIHRIGDLQLLRSGTGSAYYAGLLRVYDAALYTAETSSGEPPRCLSLSYRVSLSKDQLIRAAEQTLLKQSVDPVALQPQLDQLHNRFRDVSDGDSFTLCHLPGEGTRLYFNGAEQVRIPGDAFARSYLGIWLGERPISMPLREALLQRKQHNSDMDDVRQPYFSGGY